jgi:glyoxylase-like metal-dependent hydrolase (beta-lactamase superfamily II)
LVLVNGHTEAQQLPLISYKNYKILFAGDLFPTYGHLPLPYVMGYDVRPLVTLEERKLFLEECVNENIVLFYEHDPYHECGLVGIDEKGKYFSKETFPLNNLT